MSFEILDDFQDPVKGGIYGFVNTVFINHTVQDEETPITDSRWHHEFPTSPIKFDKHNHVLQWMVTKESLVYRYIHIDFYYQVKYERTRLLQHPVVRELVSYKWKAYAMPVFMISFAVYLVFLACLTAFALVTPLPTDAICTSSDVDCTNG